ncbi:hypothetical protein [Aquibacillus halophilus]|uniref:hypothetical protein n=1 Tax=Aquibacillus halophilus TaxID=930132 RepID=UPI0030B82FF4
MDPTTVTTSGRPARYFNGIAIKRRRIREVPSIKPDILNMLIGDVNNLIPPL